MSHQARDKTIEAFGKENSKMKIMIASLKCGGIGRELTHKEDLDRWDINEAPVNLTMALESLALIFGSIVAWSSKV